MTEAPLGNPGRNAALAATALALVSMGCGGGLTPITVGALSAFPHAPQWARWLAISGPAVLGVLVGAVAGLLALRALFAGGAKTGTRITGAIAAMLALSVVVGGLGWVVVWSGVALVAGR